MHKHFELQNMREDIVGPCSVQYDSSVETMNGHSKRSGFSKSRRSVKPHKKSVVLPDGRIKMVESVDHSDSMCATVRAGRLGHGIAEPGQAIPRDQLTTITHQ